ncbi:MAG: 30S ribosomal protein S16 [Bacilli bacterium]|nr:30S ribosomal protein S16 [Bacilli bacterium]
MVKIRLARIGRHFDPSYRIVVTDSRNARDGAFIAQIGNYDPTGELKDAKIDEEKAIDWLLKGAIPSDTIRKMFTQNGIYAKYLEAKKSIKKAK